MSEVELVTSSGDHSLGHLPRPLPFLRGGGRPPRSREAIQSRQNGRQLASDHSGGPSTAGQPLMTAPRPVMADLGRITEDPDGLPRTQTVYRGPRRPNEDPDGLPRTQTA